MIALFRQTYLPKKTDKLFIEYMKLLNKNEYQLAQEGITFYLETIKRNIKNQGKKEGVIDFLRKDLEELGKDMASI